MIEAESTPADQAVQRCPWAGTDPLMVAYHDEEWGVPCHDDRDLFERLLLEGFQAGLSWATILRKRASFRNAFDGFDPRTVAAYGDSDVARLLNDPGIVRNRLKIGAAIGNARAFLAVTKEGVSFDHYVWSFVGGEPLADAAPATITDIPVRTDISDALSRDLKRLGFSFVGSTICYAFMQSAGLVDDHVERCFRAVPARSI